MSKHRPNTNISEAIAFLTSADARRKERWWPESAAPPVLAGFGLQGLDLRGVYLSGLDLQQADLTGTNLSGADLRGASLTRAILDATCLSGADATGARFSAATLIRADLRRAQLSRADFSRADLTGADLNGADLSESNLTAATLIGVDLRGVDLKGVTLINADLSRADLSGARLQRMELVSVKLMNANLQRADLMDGCARFSDLSGADLRGADFGGADLSDCTLARADLTHCNLAGANLHNSVLDDAIVHNVRVGRLSGFPKPPERLRIGDGGRIILGGEPAKRFFVGEETVEVVLDRAVPIEVLGAYHIFIAELHAQGRWPANLVYAGGRVEHERTVLSFRAPSAGDVVAVLPVLLQPFRLADAVDWGKSLAALTLDKVDAVVGAVLALAPLRSLVATRLREFPGFAEAIPTVVRVANQMVDVRIDPAAMRAFPEVGRSPLQLTFVEGGQHMSEGNVFVGGDMVASAVGSGARVNATDIGFYKNAIDKSQRLDAELKGKLKAAREAVDVAGLPEGAREDVTDDLGKLTGELEKTPPDPARVKTIWSRIKDAAPTVASILASAAAIGKLVTRG